MAKELDIPLEWEDKTIEGEDFDSTFVGTLRPGQREAVEAMAVHRLGVLCAPPGAGKTVMASALIAHHGKNTLILVHRQPLVEQWKLRLSSFLGIDPKAIGVVGGGKDRRNGRLDIAMVQSLVRDTQVVDWIAGYGQVIVDECHHIPAVSVEKVLKEVKARHVYGLTATPRRKDGLQKILHFQCGPVRHKIIETTAALELEKILEIRETGIAPPEQEGAGGIQLQFGALASHAGRTQRIADDVAAMVRTGSHPLVLTERVEHLEALALALKEQVENLVVLKGGGSAKARRVMLDQLAALPPEAPWAILATGRYIGEGFDESRLDTLVLAMPMSWKGTLIQYAGRIMREHDGKSQVRIVDYADEGRLLRSMLRKRQIVWRGLGFKART
jgi:superfamily II DNA or RNA helicase